MIPVTANVVIETFVHGGWIMWPLLAAFFLALCVIIDRVVWWMRFTSSIRRNARAEGVDALANGDFATAWNAARGSKDPFLENLREGISHASTSMTGAMMLHATRVIERSEARMWVLSTLITLAPLLGLLGTVVGIMQSFSFVGDEDLAATKVSGGIAEALIATAGGIAIAVLALLPYNFLRKRVSLLRGRFERFINYTELLVQSAKNHGHDIEDFAARLHPAPTGASSRDELPATSPLPASR